MPRARTALALVAAVIAVIAVVVLAAPGAGRRSLRVASSGPLSIRYGQLWRSLTAGGQLAAVESDDISAPIALARGSTRLVAGPLVRSAVVPGGAPPDLVRLYGSHYAATPAMVAGHPGERYMWTLADGSQVAEYVVPTATTDLSISCFGPSDSAALRSCEQLAPTARVNGVQVIAPGPDTQLLAAIQSDLAAVSAERERLDGLGGSLTDRSNPAATVARLERTATAQLAQLAPLARNRVAFTSLRDALRQEMTEFAALSTAAARGSRRTYAELRLRAITASRSVSDSARQLAAEGLEPLALPALYLVGLPAVHHARDDAVDVGLRLHTPGLGLDHACFIRSRHLQRPSTPVYQPTQSAPATSAPASPSTSVVVVPTQQHSSSGSSSPSTVVVIPTSGSSK